MTVPDTASQTKTAYGLLMSSPQARWLPVGLLILLMAACGPDDSSQPEAVETIQQGGGQTSGTASTQVPETETEVTTTSNDASADVDDIFTVDDSGITLIGAALSRNGILNQLVDFDEAEILGGPLIDQPVDINVTAGTMGEVLGQLLDGVSYQARFEKQSAARMRLHTLWLGTEAMKPQLVVQQVSTDDGNGLVSPLSPADGSLDAGEDYVKVVSQQYADGDSEAKKMAIMDVEVTEGGVAFLANVMRTAQDEEVLIEAIRRLEIGEEFGAKWALLKSLNHTNSTIVLEILESIEVWRDPTIKKYIEPLTFHGNKDVREKALELVDDLNTYAEVGVAADPYDIEQSTRPQMTAEQLQQMQAQQKQKRQKAKETMEKLRKSQSETGAQTSSTTSQ